MPHGKAERPQPAAAMTFSALMVQHGFAPEAVALLASKHILKTGGSRDTGRARFIHYVDNYYMQFLALQLERYGFNINRPFIEASELSHAAGIIEGKHGNPPLDTAHLIALLTETADAIMNAQTEGLMTWDSFFEHIYIAQDGSTIRGQDIIKGLIKSNLQHKGAAIENYNHNYRGRIFTTLSMLQVVEQQLEELQPQGLKNINRLGQPIHSKIIGEARTFAFNVSTLPDPKFADYLSISAHNRIKAGLKDIILNLKSLAPDLKALEFQRQQLARDYFNPGIYSKAWREYLFRLDDYLRQIATPYV